MSRLNEMKDAGMNHHVSIKNNKGKTLIKLPLVFAVVIVVAAPQLLVVILIAMVLELIELEYDGRQLNFD